MKTKHLLTVLALILTSCTPKKANKEDQNKTARYGICARWSNNHGFEYIEKQFARICDVAHVHSLEETGMELTTGLPVCIVKDHEKAQKVHDQLQKEGYNVAIIEVNLDSKSESLNVMTFKTQQELMKDFNQLLS